VSGSSSSREEEQSRAAAHQQQLQQQNCVGDNAADAAGSALEQQLRRLGGAPAPACGSSVNNSHNRRCCTCNVGPGTARPLQSFIACVCMCSRAMRLANFPTSALLHCLLPAGMRVWLASRRCGFLAQTTQALQHRYEGQDVAQKAWAKHCVDTLDCSR
jgi:hypothetical protein